MKVNTKALAVLSGAALLLALSGCGGDDSGKKQDAWAKSVCDPAQAQLKKIDDANASLAKVDSAGTPADVKNADSAAFQNISSAYASLARVFQQAGPAPKGDDGQKFQQNAVTVFTNLSTQYEGLKKQVDALPTDDQAKFADGLQGVSTNLKKVSADGEAAKASLRTGDAGKALAKQPGCTSVAGTASPTSS